VRFPVGRFTLVTAARIFWAATLLTLPVTSFRYFPAGEGTYVRPLAFYPLILLVLTLLILLVRGRTTLPLAGALTPLAAFLLVTILARLMGLLLAPIPMRGQDATGRIIRAWAALLMGILLFVAAIWMNRDHADLRFTVRWLLAGLVLDILWSGLQGVTFYLHLLPKALVTRWQRAFSLRELIRTNRISGLAYEPSWLAGQIATLYLPWLVAALLTRERHFRYKWLEPCLLALTTLLLLTTFSRGGILTAGFAGFMTLILIGRRQMRAVWIWFKSGFSRRGALLGRLTLILLGGVAIAGALLFVGQKGYISRLWNTRATSLEDFLIQNSAGARAAYLWGAMGAYQDHPWSGVGLGASGFYIYSHLPDWALTTVPEIARQLSPDSTLYPNPKNLYVRLLAETGLIGFILYGAFQFSLLGDSLVALGRESAPWRYLGIASIFSWLALVVYNMTQDSLASPSLWINLGILAGMSESALGSAGLDQPRGVESRPKAENRPSRGGRKLAQDRGHHS
jgi:O-antigen ligase